MRFFALTEVFMNHIVIDLEFNQASSKRGNKDSLAECPFEIIQIGAVKLNDSLEITDRFTCLIKPQIYTKMNSIVEEITGISDEILEDCPYFQEAFSDFASFAKDKSNTDYVLYTWGSDDIKSLLKNIKYFKCNADLITNKYINIQPVAAKLLNSTSGGTIGLKNAAEYFGINTDLKFHDALNDAEYTARILERIFTELPQPTEFSVKDIKKTSSKKKHSLRIDTDELIHYFETALERKLTGEETAIALTAYKLGRKRKYEVE